MYISHLQNMYISHLQNMYICRTCIFPICRTCIFPIYRTCIFPNVYDYVINLQQYTVMFKQQDIQTDGTRRQGDSYIPSKYCVCLWEKGGIVLVSLLVFAKCKFNGGFKTINKMNMEKSQVYPMLHSALYPASS